MGKRHAWQAFRAGQHPPTFDFLGFTHYWGKSRTGKARLKRKTSKKRLRRALVAIKHWLRQERNARRLPDLWQAMGRKMRGHFNYFGVTDNSRALYRFEHAVHQLLFKGLNRRSQRRSFTWERFRRYCHPAPPPTAWTLGTAYSRGVNARLKRLVRENRRQASVRGRRTTSAGSNTVTLPRPKGGRNREHKADLHTGGVLSTRPPWQGNRLTRGGRPASPL